MFLYSGSSIVLVLGVGLVVVSVVLLCLFKVYIYITGIRLRRLRSFRYFGSETYIRRLELKSNRSAAARDQGNIRPFPVQVHRVQELCSVFTESSREINAVVR